MLTLYQAEWGSYCHRVRQVQTELELTYTCVNVPLSRTHRAQVRELSGQQAVPVLKDGRKVIVGSQRDHRHLRRTPSSASTDAEDTRRLPVHRVVLELDVDPDEALAQGCAPRSLRSTSSILDETRPPRRSAATSAGRLRAAARSGDLGAGARGGDRPHCAGL